MVHASGIFRLACGSSLVPAHEGGHSPVTNGGLVRARPRKYHRSTSQELHLWYKFIPSAPRAGVLAVFPGPGPAKYSCCTHFTTGACVGWCAGCNLEIFTTLSPLPSPTSHSSPTQTRASTLPISFSPSPTLNLANLTNNI
jgi:hypothetical protein